MAERETLANVVSKNVLDSLGLATVLTGITLARMMDDKPRRRLWALGVGSSNRRRVSAKPQGQK